MLFNIVCFLSIILSSLSISVPTCDGISESNQCSPNKECGCFYRWDKKDDSGICGLTTLRCSSMIPCSTISKTCHDHNSICIEHPLCDYRSLCYPLDKATDEICPSWNKTSITTTSRPISSTASKPFHPSCDWSSDSNTVLNKLKGPTGLFLDDRNDTSIYIADSGNHRILLWTPEQSINNPISISMKETDRLSYPRDIVIDKMDESIFICDKGNKRVLKWMKDSKISHTIIPNIECESLLIDNQGSLIISEINKDRITKWEKINSTQSNVHVIAGGYGKGSNLNQLNQPRNIIFNENDQSIYISDSANHRIIKWIKGAKEGIVIAGGNGQGNGTHQLAFPRGIALHSNGDIFIADTSNHRIVRWTQQAKSGTIIIDGDQQNSRQLLSEPFDLIFDQHYRNLYVTDWTNSRLLRFFIDGMGNCVTIT
ncbi:unnamed protein product [Adineta steineri]|uniref:Uncharacterized protein n=1 Tax=Adineta steineri TaxID=433720 RepID=A0A814PPP0_9BILA|nr:unnamed protein product [Adineta steineri]CAF4018119.1 unnamed protein product [Adineta steineri]